MEGNSCSSLHLWRIELTLGNDWIDLINQFRFSEIQAELTPLPILPNFLPNKLNLPNLVNYKSLKCIKITILKILFQFEYLNFTLSII